MRVALALLVAASCPIAIAGQTPTPAPAGPTFDVVSIKPASDPRGFPRGVMSMRPDGALTVTRGQVPLLLSLAYQMSTADMVGLPDWALREAFDIVATSSVVNPALEDRAAMVRAMLTDRFRMLAHIERREVPSFDLVLARSDGKLGAGLVKADTDCDAFFAARRKEAEAAVRAGTPPPPPQRFEPGAAPPPCILMPSSNGLRGEATMGTFTSALRGPAGRVVVDKTGLEGTYRMNLVFDVFATLRGPGAQPPADDLPTVFTAVRELGLRLDASRTERDVLVLDRLERPTEN
jgi:uncharacterized protein (TIGR03435 family)